jgi:hypothetical protein
VLLLGIRDQSPELDQPGESVPQALAEGGRLCPLHPDELGWPREALALNVADAALDNE